ncbi:MAG: hypothetical protein ACI39Q_07295 [Wujia sp.]
MRKLIVRLLSLMMGCFIIFACCEHSIVFAADTAQILTTTSIIEKIDDNQYLIPIVIYNNPGVMGFRIHLQCVSDETMIFSVSKGSVTSVGSFDSDVSSDGSDYVDVLWNNINEITEDGSVMYIGVEASAEKDIHILISYDQQDTFNEKYEDVSLECHDIIIPTDQEKDETTEDLTTEESINQDEINNLIHNSDEDKIKQDAKEDVDNNMVEDKIGTDNIKEALIKSLAYYKVDSPERISEENEEEFYNTVKKYLQSTSGVDQKLVNKLDIKKAVNHVKLTEDDYDQIFIYQDDGIPEVENVNNSNASNVRKWLVNYKIFIIVGALLVSTILIIIWRRKRHGKNKE